jgi:glycosyltransferase involved in cell wall biosynthesis
VKRRIVWLIDSLSPGGAEQLMPSLLNHFNRDQFEMRVCVLQIKRGNPISKEIEELGISVDLIQIHSLKNPFNIFRILHYFIRHSPDLIHTQLEFSDILGNIAAKILRKPSVSTLHTLDVMKNYKFSASRKILKWFVLKKYCDRIITVSNKTREHHIQFGRIPQEKIKTIYNGIQLSRFRNRNPSVLAEKKHALNLNPQHKIITTIAVLRELKGIQYMINAMSIILDRYSNTTYLIIGDGEYGASLQQLITDLRLDEHVIMAGYRTDIPDMLAISDLFVLPSLGDALPTVLIEALAAGTPIVATNVGGIPEIIEDGKNGLLVPAADSQNLANACLQLIESEERAKRLSIAGFETANRRFNVNTQVELLGNIYKELIDTDR